VARSPAHPSPPTEQSDPGQTISGQTIPGQTGLVELIDLHTAEPAELERLLEQWRSTELADEHLTSAEIARDDADCGHLVLQVEYEPKATAGLAASRSPEAGLVAALLDRPPRFRRPTSH
jgi:hypothetical protein